MLPVHFKLPLPPTINHYYKQRRNGGRYIGEEGVLFRQQVKIITAAGPHFGDSRLNLEIVLHFKTRARNDLSNRIKSLEDALMHAGLFNDDEQIDILTVRRGDVIKSGLCVVTITRLLDTE